MGREIALRNDFDGVILRRLARASKDAGQSRRRLALAENYDGGKRTGAARIGSVGFRSSGIGACVLTPKVLIDKLRSPGPSSTMNNAKPLPGCWPRRPQHAPDP